MTICHDMRFISEIVIYHCMEKVIRDSLTLYTRMTTIVVMNIGTLITNDDYSRHGHYRVVSALYPAATQYTVSTCHRKSNEA